MNLKNLKEGECFLDNNEKRIRFVKNMLEYPLEDYDFEGGMLLHIAVESGCLSAVQFLLECGICPNSESDYGLKMIHYAAHDDDGRMVSLLARYGADVNAYSGGYGSCVPLHYAVEGHLESTVEALLANGADPTLKNADGDTPLDVAIQLDNPKIQKMLRDTIERRAASKGTSSA